MCRLAFVPKYRVCKLAGRLGRLLIPLAEHSVMDDGKVGSLVCFLVVVGGRGAESQVQECFRGFEPQRGGIHYIYIQYLSLSYYQLFL